jgi:endodeoxyribonuclease RusA
MARGFLETEIRLMITYFHRDAPTDLDNIVKPLLDSLKLLVYRDDDQVTDLQGERGFCCAHGSLCAATEARSPTCSTGGFLMGSL